MLGSTAVEIQIFGIECIPLLVCFGLKMCDSILTFFVNLVFPIRLFGDIQQVGTTWLTELRFFSSVRSGHSFFLLSFFPHWKHLDLPWLLVLNYPFTSGDYTCWMKSAPAFSWSGTVRRGLCENSRANLIPSKTSLYMHPSSEDARYPECYLGICTFHCRKYRWTCTCYTPRTMMSLLPTPDLQWPPLQKFCLPRKY